MSDSEASKYAAFISYRHVDPDRGVAQWLHKKLETYRVPTSIRSEHLDGRRIGRVFRDEEELSAAAHLGDELKQRLRDSRFLVVICSPRTPQSEWVNQEVEYFRSLGREDRVLAVLAEGEPSQSFPPALLGTDEQVTPGDTTAPAVEPLAADVRRVEGTSVRHRHRVALLKLMARMLAVDFDTLYQRDARRRRVRWIQAAAAAAVLLGLFLYQFDRLRREETRRVRAELDRNRAELARTTAEQAAATEEARRKKAELEKANAERLQAQADLKRERAEREKAEAETRRKEAERAKAQADLEKAAAETREKEADLEAARAEAERKKEELRRYKAEERERQERAEKIREQERRAAAQRRKRVLSLARAAGSERRAGRHELAALLAYQALREARKAGPEYVARADQALRDVAYREPYGELIRVPPEWQARWVAMGSDSSAVAVAAWRTSGDGAPGAVLVYDLEAPSGQAPPRVLELSVKPRWVDFDPTGERIVASAEGNRLLVWKTGTNPQSPQTIRVDTSSTYLPSMSPRHARVALYGGDGRLRVVDLDADGRVTAYEGTPPGADRGLLVHDASGRHLFGVGDGDFITAWDLTRPGSRGRAFYDAAARRRSAQNDETAPSIDGAALSRDGRRLIGIRGQTGERLIWDLAGNESARGRPIAKVLTQDEHIAAALVGPRSGWAAGLSARGALLLWRHQAPRPHVIRFRGHERMTLAADFSGDESRIVTSDRDEVRVWHLDKLRVPDRGLQYEALEMLRRSGEKVGKILRGTQESYLIALFAGVRDIAWRPDGRQLAVVHGGGMPLPALPGVVESGWIDGLRFFDPRRLEAGSRVLRFNPGGIAPALQRRALPSHPLQVAYSGNGDHVAAATGAQVLAWQAHDLGAPPVQLREQAVGDQALAFDPRPDVFAFVSGGASGRVTYWKRQGQRVVGRDLATNVGKVWRLCMGPEGRIAAGGNSEGALHLIPVDGGGTTTHPRAHEDVITALAMDPKGALLASGGADGALHVWARRGAHLTRQFSLPFPDRTVRDAAFGPNGALLAVALGGRPRPPIEFGEDSEDDDDAESFGKTARGGSVFLVDLRGRDVLGDPIAWEIARYEDSVGAIAISPDGRYITAGTDAGVLERLPLSTDALADTVASMVRRNLTRAEWIRYVSEDSPYEKTVPSLPEGK